MKQIIVCSLVAFCSFCSCAEKEPDQDSSLSNGSAPAAVTTAVADSQRVTAVDTSKLLTPGQVVVNPMPQQAVNQATATTAPGMNPPHGQPNHRCDIAVGAPLNSPATKPATQTTTTQTAAPVVTQTATTTPNTVTAPGMNPPHGQPNHRCDIAVGAPLNSPATKPATQNVAPVVVPAKKDGGR